MSLTVIVIGVSGVGKSVVAAELVRLTGWAFAEGDDLHPEANRRKMSAGHPLDDDDRWPWLHRIAGWIGEQEAHGRDAVVTCSALRRGYREVLREGHPSVRFLQLLVPPQLIDQRLAARRDHFMPASLLGSQLAAGEDLQPDEPGSGIDGGADARTTAELALRTITSWSS